MQIFDIVAAVLVLGASISLLWTEKWRFNILAVALQYMAVFWFVSQVWPIGLASVKLISGWMAAAILGSSVNALGGLPVRITAVSGKIFRILAASLVVILAFSVAPNGTDWIPLTYPALFSSILLIGMGLLQLGMTSGPFRIIIGLMNVLCGFEIIYAAVVSSILVAGLLALVALGIALTGAYWLSLLPVEEQP